MILVIDIGNTSIKLSVMDHLNVYKLIRSDVSTFTNEILNLKQVYPDIKEVAYCNVGDFPYELKEFLKVNFEVVFEINHQIKLPFNNRYESLTLGNDRIALVAGGLFTEGNNTPLLVIDAGTCVTYDFIDSDKNYFGGAISPGLQLRYQSLHNFTENLPLLKPQPTKNITGYNTETSIHSGVVLGMTLELKGAIKQYRKAHKDLKVLITGGDSELLVKQLKNRFFATPFLMLYGIYNLYLFNKNL
ncbi:type III pantothenate kinase [Nonlabens dokdonensis]|nr:type III pantothenate kinase [Nonlabens dokdonensis]PZX41085.1 type III pantothenate kinase [Nonlabens dokdonensis]